MYVNAGSTFNLTGGTKLLGNRNLVNLGTVNWSDGKLIFSGNSTITNSGVFNVQADANPIAGSRNTDPFIGTGALSGATSFINTAQGTLLKSAGLGSATLGSFDASGRYGFFNLFNVGTVNVQSGNLRLWGSAPSVSRGTFNLAGNSLEFRSGTYSLTSGASISGNGIIYIGGADVSTAGNVNLGNNALALSWGSLTTTGPQTVPNLFFSGGSFGCDGAISLSGNSTWTGGALTGSGSLQVNAAGSLDISGGYKGLGSRTLTNLGSINILQGTLDNSSGTIDQRGELTIASGASLQSASGLTNQAGGLISGSGSLNLGSSTLTNAGTISPGGSGSAGTLTINGNLALAPTSQLLIDLTGSGSTPAAYDRLAVNGNLELGGGLSASLSAGFSPAAGTGFDVVIATGTSSGTFSSTSLPSGFTGALLTPSATPPVPFPTYRLTSGTGGFSSCAGFCWDAGGGSDTRWSTAANWFNDLVPGAAGGSEIVYLYFGTGASITLDDARTVEALFSSPGNNLTILNGGSLSLLAASTASNVYGGVTLQSGGSLSVAGTRTATLAGGFTQAGGSLTGSGSVRLEGTSNTWHAGTWGGGGSTDVAAGARLLLAPTNLPLELSGRSIRVAGAGHAELMGYLKVSDGSTNALNVESGGTLSFSRAPWTAATELSDTGLQSVYGRIDLTTSGTTQVGTGANSTLRSASSPGQPARINWISQGPVTVAADSTLALYTTPYGANLSSEGAVAQLSGSLQVPTGATLASTSSSLTITPPSTGSLQLGGTLLVNAGTTTLNLGVTTNSTIGTVKLIDGSLALNGSSSPSTATSIGDLQLLGGTLSGSGALAITQAFSRGTFSVLAPGAFSALSITQASGNLSPGALSVAGPLELEASSGALSLNAPVSAGSILGFGNTGLSIDAAASLTASDSSGLAIGLSSGNGTFLNSAGSAALSVAPGAFWQIYAASPLSTPIANLGGLAYASKQYGKTPFDTVPIAGSGNGLLYAFSPSLSASLVGPISKQYDASTTASLLPANLSLSGVQAGDSLQLNGPTSASYASKDAGTGKLVSVSGLSLASASETASGVPVYGYSLASGSATGTVGTITPKALSITGINAVSTTYGTPAATGNVAFSGLISGDLVTSTAVLVNPSNSTSGNLRAGSYAQPAASITGSDALNYSLAAPFTTSTSNYVVSPLPLNGAAIASGSSVYGSALNPGSVSFSNILSGDLVGSSASVDIPSLSRSTSGNPIVGSYRQSATGLRGADSGNYSFVGGFTSAPNYSINPLALSITGINAVNTTYGTPAATGNVAFSGLISGDQVTSTAALVNPSTGTSGNLRAGSYAQTAASFTGSDAPNYSLTAPFTTSTSNYVVSPKTLTITGTIAADRPYDGTSNASITPGTLSGLIGSEQLNLSASGVFDSRNAGSRFATATYTLANDSASGGLASNYSLAPTSALAATITKAPLTITANSGSAIYNGTIQSISGFSASGLQGADSIADLPGITATGSGRNAGSYPTIAAGSTQNYEPQFVNGVFSIARAPLTISAVSDSRIYDGSTVSSGIPVLSAGRLFGGDSLSNLSQSFSSRNALGDNTSTLAVNPGFLLSDGNSGNNYAVTTATARGTITPAAITVLFNTVNTLTTPTFDPSSGSVALSSVTIGQLQGVVAADIGKVAVVLVDSPTGMDGVLAPASTQAPAPQESGGGASTAPAEEMAGGSGATAPAASAPAASASAASAPAASAPAASAPAASASAASASAASAGTSSAAQPALAGQLASNNRLTALTTVTSASTSSAALAAAVGS